MKDIKSVLKTFWSYDEFRFPQQEIIESILAGNDTLALLPTGGGKSVCFQVPALVMDGICMVVSPLIALMKDQVENLRSRNIEAIAIHSGMGKNEIDLALDSCIYGKIKLLYVSPERLANDLFKIRLAKMKVNLLAVDEAHCISQWGYDFRPSYLKIAEIREELKDVPVLALTATATPEVQKDMMLKLNFKKENFFVKSFERKNLTYANLYEENKPGRVARALSKTKGSAIIYVRNRKKTKEIAEYLTREGVAATFYHAGLDHKTRAERQNEWMGNKKRVIVATNAFGMGIDKPDVRLVIHYEPPDNLESYFQEAGRAGRDEKKSFSVQLYNQSDINDIVKRFDQQFPPEEEIKNVYQSLANFFKLAVGAGEGTTYDFDLTLFCKNFKLDQVSTFHALKWLEQEGLIALTDSIYLPSRIHILFDKENLYRFEVTHDAFTELIKTILRSCPGVMDQYVNMYEHEMARHLKISVPQLKENLNRLESFKLLRYEPQSDHPKVIFLKPREESRRLQLDRSLLKQRKGSFEKRQTALLNYLQRNDRCRSMMLLEYFGQKELERCGQCDVCLKLNQIELNEREFEKKSNAILELLENGPLMIPDILKQMNIQSNGEDQLIKVLQWLLDNKILERDDSSRIMKRNQ